MSTGGTGGTGGRTFSVRAADISLRRNKPCACCQLGSPLLFLYREVLDAELPGLSSVEATKTPEVRRSLPTEPEQEALQLSLRNPALYVPMPARGQGRFGEAIGGRCIHRVCCLVCVLRADQGGPGIACDPITAQRFLRHVQ